MKKERGVAKGEKESNTLDGRAPERKFFGGNLSTIDLSNEIFFFSNELVCHSRRLIL